jgi:rRNA-processing protein FCF1
MCHPGFMLDTNVFNCVVNDKSIALTVFKGRDVFVTHVQSDELNATRNNCRRQILREAFKRIKAASIPTDTAVFDESKWDQAKWSANDGVYDQLLARIKERDAAKHKKARDPMNPSRDARIAETAIKAGLTIVTNDCNLARAATEAGGRVISFEEFCSAT